MRILKVAATVMLALIAIKALFFTLGLAFALIHLAFWAAVIGLILFLLLKLIAK